MPDALVMPVMLLPVPSPLHGALGEPLDGVLLGGLVVEEVPDGQLAAVALADGRVNGGQLGIVVGGRVGQNLGHGLRVGRGAEVHAGELEAAVVAAVAALLEGAEGACAQGVIGAEQGRGLALLGLADDLACAGDDLDGLLVASLGELVAALLLGGDYGNLCVDGVDLLCGRVGGDFPCQRQHVRAALLELVGVQATVGPSVHSGEVHDFSFR